jgi:tetratricopeptide (TPR) repeat protein
MGLHHLDNPAQERQPESRTGLGLDVPLIVKTATVVAALLFLVRSTPQGYLYFEGAVLNGKGLIYMDAADSYSSSDKQMLLDLSQKNFEKGLKLNPTFVTAYYKLGHVYNQVGDIDKAIETYEKLDSYFPHYSEIHLNLGIMYSVKAEQLKDDEKLKMVEKAYREIKEAARQELKPNVQSIAGMIGQSLAQLYESKDQKDKALKVYEEMKQYYRNIIDYEPMLEEYRQEKKKHYPEAQPKLILLATLTGKIQETEKVLAAMYREHPDDPSYLNALMSYYDKDKQYKAKAEFLAKAASEDPVNTGLRKLLADAYQEAGEPEKSYRELRKIELLAPKDKEALKDLYLLSRKSNDEQAAAEYLKKLAAAGVDPQSLTSPTVVADVSTATAKASSTSAVVEARQTPQPTAPVAVTTAPAKIDAVTTPADTPTTALQ